MSQNVKKRVELLFALAILFFVELIYFRNIIFTTALIGDSGDARLNNLILEHWYKVFIGAESFLNLNIFYPVLNTVTYTDLLLGYSVPYILLRVVGVETYVANKIVILLLHTFGTTCLLILLRRILKCTWISTVIGVIAFSLSNAVFAQAGHTQLYTVCVVPLLILYIIMFFRDIKKNRIVKKRYGIGVILSFAWILYTGFYIAFFSALLMIIYGFVVFCMCNKRELIRNIKDFISLNHKTLFIYIILAVVLAAPFLGVYLPTLRLFGLRDWGNISVFLPNILDYINVDSNNYLYGSFKEKYNLSTNVELSTGIPILTLILFIACYILIRKFYYERQQGFFYIRALCVTVILTWILLLKSDGKSLWWLIYKIVPGGGAIRAPFRINMILVLFIAIIFAFTCTYIEKRILGYKKLYCIIFSLLGGVIFLDNITIGGVYSNWDSKERITQMKMISVPPKDCQSFIIKDSGGMNMAFHDYNLLAWEIADKFNLKTVNGYSGQFPEGWPINNFIYDNNSLFILYNWIDLYDLSNVYVYDVNLNLWTELEDRISYWYDENNKSILIDEGYIKDDRIVLYPEGFVWGPYISLSEGSYMIRIKSKDIKKMKFVCTSDSGESKVELEEENMTGDIVVYEFKLLQDTDNVEFKLYNISDQDIEFDYIEVIKMR